MSIGDSGRIVVELPPSVKRELHAALVCDGLTLKAWLIAKAEDYLTNRKQSSIFEETKSVVGSALHKSMTSNKESI